MKTKHILFRLIVLTAFLIAACGGNPTTKAMMESTPNAMMSHETPTADAMMPKETPSTESMMESPAWFGMSLTNAHTGESFTIQDFKGKVILVETMAVWCSNCLKQQTQVKVLHGLVGNRDDFVSLGLDIDPNEDVSKLKSFIEGQGFDWLYSISPADVSREIASLYGDQFLNPPSTPMLVIDKHGVAHPLPFGIKSAEELLQAIQPFLDESI
ncbi:MAG: hypothetical protein IH588_11120 [Anaerolineales bacterium]|nr:hypothetical protein [Anaerolineales bacterium]